MRVEDLINELQNIVNDGKVFPLTGRKIVDTERLMGLIDEIQGALPSEIRQARDIVADKTKIVSAAKKEAEEIVRDAEARRKALVNQNEIVRLANQQANDIINDAKLKSKEMRKASNEYVDELMRKTDEAITAQLTELRKTRQGFKASQRSSG